MSSNVTVLVRVKRLLAALRELAEGLNAEGPFVPIEVEQMNPLFQGTLLNDVWDTKGDQATVDGQTEISEVETANQLARSACSHSSGRMSYYGVSVQSVECDSQFGLLTAIWGDQKFGGLGYIPFIRLKHRRTHEVSVTFGGWEDPPTGVTEEDLGTELNNLLCSIRGMVASCPATLLGWSEQHKLLGTGEEAQETILNVLQVLRAEDFTWSPTAQMVQVVEL